MTRRALVTGSSRGIGRSIALELARQGFDIAVHCRRDREAAELTCARVRELGRATTLLEFDIVDRAACAAALADDMATHGVYYAVVLNAGIARDAPFPALTGDDWDAVLRTNLDGFYNVLRPVVMPMVSARAAGRIVTISSISGVLGNRGQVNYSAAKAGIIGATRALSRELAKRAITVNCIAPGIIDTEMLAGLDAEELKKRIPMRRLGRPEEVAAMAGFLCSEPAGYITGAVIAIDGGLS